MLLGNTIKALKNHYYMDLPKEEVDYLNSIAISIEEAVKFDLGDVSHVEKLNINFSNRNYKIRIPKLPFDKNYFEIIAYDKKHYGAIIEYIEGKVCGYTFCQGRIPGQDSGENDLFLTPINLFFIENEQGELSITKDECLVPEKIAINTFTALMLIIEAIHIINCSNVIIKDHKAGNFINQKRKAKGKPPIYTYKTLHIDTSQQEITKNPGGGTHASPRVHLRRGHIRKLPNGKTTWIQPCIVGKNTEGVVDKDYSLSDPTTIHTNIPMIN